MRKKVQKIRRQTDKGSQDRRREKGAGFFSEYRVTGDSFEPIRIFACSPGQAEQVGRNILGVSRPYQGPVEVRRVERSTPADRKRR